VKIHPTKTLLNWFLNCLCIGIRTHPIYFWLYLPNQIVKYLKHTSKEQKNEVNIKGFNVPKKKIFCVCTVTNSSNPPPKAWRNLQTTTLKKNCSSLKWSINNKNLCNYNVLLGFEP